MTGDAEARLLTERSAAMERLSRLTAEISEVVHAASGSNLDDEHDPEGATIAFEREQLSALRAQTENQLRELDAALERLRLRTYGRCENCGRPIARERLEALPAARLCVNCAGRARRKQSAIRP